MSIIEKVTRLCQDRGSSAYARWNVTVIADELRDKLRAGAAAAFVTFAVPHADRLDSPVWTDSLVDPGNLGRRP